MSDSEQRQTQSGRRYLDYPVMNERELAAIRRLQRSMWDFMADWREQTKRLPRMEQLHFTHQMMRELAEWQEDMNRNTCPSADDDDSR
jgi:hypothetical protein